MRSDWREVSVGDLGRIVTGKTPQTSIVENYGGLIPFLTPSDNMGVKHVESTAKKLTARGLSEVKNCLLPPNSICVSCIGSDLGKVVMTTRETVTNQQINSIIPTKNVDADFVYYAMTILGKELNYISKTSTAVPIVNKSSFSSYTISLPDLEEQRAISSVLSALDARIANNSKINHHLEQMAQAIFDDSFPDISLGNNTIGDYISPKRGKNLILKDAVIGNVPIVAGGLNPAAYHKVSNTVAPVITISASGANAGFVKLWNVPVWSSDSSFIDSQMTPYVYFWYVLLKIRQKEIFDSQTGSAQPHIYPQHIEVMPIADINLSDVVEYNKKVTPVFRMIGSSLAENQNLKSLRDTILPHLMSGDLSVNTIDNTR